MNKTTHAQKHGIYDIFTSLFLPIILTLFFILGIALSLFFIKRFLIERYDPTVFLLIAILLCPWIYIISELIRSGLMLRLLLRMKIDKIGIHCYLFGVKRYTIMWEDVRTYGIIGHSFAYVSKTLILFSLDAKEYAPLNSAGVYKVCENRLIIQYRTDIWDDLMRHMPEDMCKKLTYALSRKQDCFHKR